MTNKFARFKHVHLQFSAMDSYSRRVDFQLSFLRVHRDLQASTNSDVLHRGQVVYLTYSYTIFDH